MMNKKMMNKKLLFGILATLLLINIVAAQEEVTINGLEVRYAYNYAVIEKYRIVTIGIIKINNILNLSDLLCIC